MAMSKLKRGKAAGPSSVPIKVIQLYNVESIMEKIGNDVINGEKMPTS